MRSGKRTHESGAEKKPRIVDVEIEHICEALNGPPGEPKKGIATSLMRIADALERIQYRLERIDGRFMDIQLHFGLSGPPGDAETHSPNRTAGR